MKRANIKTKGTFLAAFISVIMGLVIIFSARTIVFAGEEDNTQETVTEEEGTAEPEVFAARGSVAEKKNVTVEVTVTQDLSLSSEGKKVTISAQVISETGETPDAGGVTIYKKEGNQKYKTFTSNSLQVSADKTYYIYAEFAGNEEYAAAQSETIELVVKKQDLKGYLVTTAAYPDQANGTVSIASDYPYFDNIVNLVYYREGNPATTVVEGKTITGLSKGTYYVSVPAFQDGNNIYISCNQKFTIAEGAQPVINKVTATADSNITWTKTYFELEAGRETVFTTKVTPVNDKEYYITDVVAEPAENATVSFYPATGEVSVSKIKGNVTLKALYEKKAAPASIELQYIKPNGEGNYSQINLGRQFVIGLLVKDESGNPVPDAKIYFKSDKSEVSYTGSKSTDADGLAEFKFSYTVEEGKDTADYNSVFSFTSDFDEELLSYTLHLIKQKKSDLVLYEDQIYGTYPEEKNGKVVGVPAGYEIWTGEVHQGALVVGTGEWAQAVNGEFTGLSTGQHLLRAGEKFDAETLTLYFASNFADFEVPRKPRTDTTEEKEETTDTEKDQSTVPGQTDGISPRQDNAAPAPATAPVPATAPAPATEPQPEPEQPAPAQAPQPAPQPVFQPAPAPAIRAADDPAAQNLEQVADADIKTSDGSEIPPVSTVTENIENESAALAETIAGTDPVESIDNSGNNDAVSGKRLGIAIGVIVLVIAIGVAVSIIYKNYKKNSAK